ncbi:MAG: Short-chain dehydrogenase [Devosia sp.]|nr:Short-chain dehydrogenase [Devosia sp.]
MSARCVAITGSTAGIGYGMAEAFARTGARLVINSHLADDAGALAKLGGLTEVHFVSADISTVAGARSFVEQAKTKLGRLDTLVNNAGTFRDGPTFDQLTEAQFDTTFNLNVKGYLFATQAFVAGLESGQDDPSVVCIGSKNSLVAEKGSVIYDASKGAVLMLVRSMAVSLAARGIRVNGIGPGIIETPLTLGGLDRPGAREVWNTFVPLGRVGRPTDIGGVAVFLASPAAAYITGEMIYVDGGVNAYQRGWDALG